MFSSHLFIVKPTYINICNRVLIGNIDNIFIGMIDSFEVVT